jgi:hypothetical protein
MANTRITQRAEELVAAPHTQPIRSVQETGRPFRTTSIDIETNEEQQLIDLKKFGVKIKGRYKDKSRLI